MNNVANPIYGPHLHQAVVSYNSRQDLKLGHHALRRARMCLSQARGIKLSQGHQAGQGAASRARGSKQGWGHQAVPRAVSKAMLAAHRAACCPRPHLLPTAILAAPGPTCCPLPCLMPPAWLDAPSLTQTLSRSSQCFQRDRLGDLWKKLKLPVTPKVNISKGSQGSFPLIKVFTRECCSNC